MSFALLILGKIRRRFPFSLNQMISKWLRAPLISIAFLKFFLRELFVVRDKGYGSVLVSPLA